MVLPCIESMVEHKAKYNVVMDQLIDSTKELADAVETRYPSSGVKLKNIEKYRDSRTGYWNCSVIYERC